MKRNLSALAILLTAFALLLYRAYGANAQMPTPHVRKAFYYHLTPKQGGQSALVGPWSSLAACRDNLGSALYSHPFACHNGWSATNCVNLGSGYGYPKGMGLHPAWRVPDSDCALLPFVATGQYGKWVRFWYGDDGSATVVIKGQKPPTTPGQFTFYADAACPDWPWIKIADRPDGVCG